MKYKVEGCIIPDDKMVGTHVVQLEVVSKWYTAADHFEAAAMFILDHPNVNCKDINVVDEDYNLGCYPLATVKWKADYLCGLRW